ncbi:hypothetical protein DFH08DRAFT_1089844 [Mycena albidolilacea]|uniref:F-box domain-containing protein n=1 Tax=Mycena albidolilacea TaxID=1033008 RepID=A0AAD7E828_9AGAR|nr:hypothetical protein DFH08DRAFT_1089844 [Mycena albidolilacea]
MASGTATMVRAHADISRWLPDGVISEIIRTAPVYDKAALCRASKLFHALGIPVLYRVVELERHDSVERFCATVLGNPSEFAGLPGRLLQILLNIEEILLHDLFLYETRQKLLSSPFPRLIRGTISAINELSSSPQREDTIVSFLIRHPGLESSYIDERCLLETSLTPSAPISMPNLQRLRAPPSVLLLLQIFT